MPFIYGQRCFSWRTDNSCPQQFIGTNRRNQSSSHTLVLTKDFLREFPPVGVLVSQTSFSSGACGEVIFIINMRHSRTAFPLWIRRGALRCSGACAVLSFSFPGRPWLPLAAPGCPWLLLGCSWLLMGCSCLWLLLVVSGCC
jgi:hypothetical protein